jgi:hypothetical protein
LTQTRQRYLTATLTYVVYALQVATYFTITGCSKNFDATEKGHTLKSAAATETKVEEVATAGARTTMAGMTQSLQQAKAKTQKKLDKLLSRRKNDLEASNKKKGKIKYTKHNAKIAACKAKKRNRQKQVTQLLATQNSQGVPTQDQADTDMQNKPRTPHRTATKVVETVRDNTETEQDENEKLASHVHSEFATKQGRKILEKMCTNERTTVAKETEQGNVARDLQRLFQKSQQIKITLQK